MSDIIESFLWMLDGNPCTLEKALEHFAVEDVREANLSKLVWFQPGDLTFYLTHLGIKFLAEKGRKRKCLPHLNWREKSIEEKQEMSADRAIELFAKPKQTQEPALVNETKLYKPKPFSPKKQDHLPKKPTFKRI